MCMFYIVYTDYVVQAMLTVTTYISLYVIAICYIHNSDLMQLQNVSDAL